jgi:hypothetical protein
MGNADGYRTLQAADLATLKASIRRAHAAGLKVVIAPLSLPGMRWSQNNHNQFDDRIWQDKKYWQEAALFWRDLALALKDEPGIVAWNLINEPAPEKQGKISEQASAEALKTGINSRQTRHATFLNSTIRLLPPSVRSTRPRRSWSTEAGTAPRAAFLAGLQRLMTNGFCTASTCMSRMNLPAPRMRAAKCRMSTPAWSHLVANR